MNEIKIGSKVKIIGKESSDSKIYNDQIGIINEIGFHNENNKEYCWINLDWGGRIPIWLDECELVEKKNKVYGIALFMMKGVVKC
jgi:pectate lyase